MGVAASRPLFARAAAWLVVTLYVAGMAGVFLLEGRLGSPDANPAEDLVLFGGFGMFAVVGALLVSRRPGNPVGWIMCAASLVVAVAAGETYAAYVMTTSGRPDWLAVLGVWTNSWYWFLFVALVFVYLPLLFPDGRLPSHRWRPVAGIAGVGVLTAVVLGVLPDVLTGQDVGYRIENPVGIAGLNHVGEMPVVLGALGLFLGVGCVGAIAAVVVRFRRSRGAEHQQIKWFLFAAAPIVTFPVQDLLPGIVGDLAFAWTLIGLPAAIGVAVLRHRLYDIDLIINRTLVYAALTASLALVYVGSVVSLQYVFRAIAGSDSRLSVVVSTLAMAALFGPLRRRLQDLVDRRFYRKKYDARLTLEAFSGRLRDEMELVALKESLVGVVREAVQPEHASLWLKEPDDGERA